ncbi:MAG: hypothetical protein WKF40_11180 [Thermoleophilaceae bacterium]
MALKVTETVGRSDVGRQREANEDNYVVASPLFAVADGMGGAQAGEVASRTAADVFEGTAGDAGSASAPARAAAHRAHPGGQPADLRDGPERPFATRHGDYADRGRWSGPRA